MKWGMGTRTFIMLFLACLAAGCGKVDNPHPNPQSRPFWLFFNYAIENTSEKPKVDSQDRLGTNAFAGVTLRLFVFGGYSRSEMLENFTQKYGGKIVVERYDTTQELMAKLARGGKYDVLMPTEQVVGRLIKEQRLGELDHKLVPNLRYIADRFRTNNYDHGLHYSVPYFWSAAGIAYNFRDLDYIPHRWQDLLYPPVESAGEPLKGKIALLPGPVRAMAAGLVSLGHEANSSEPHELAAAAAHLEKGMEKWNYQFLRGGLVDALIKEEILIAQAYGSEAAYAARTNKSIHFTIPEDGTWVTVGSFVITKEAQGKSREMAHAFLNYLLEPTVAAKVVNSTFFATTVSAAKGFVVPEIRLGAPYIVPTKVLDQDLDATGTQLREAYWKELTNRFHSVM
jgi:spermidine/putrescine-binding protein